MLNNMQLPSFHIPSPCQEDWVSMSPAERGRHCAKCDKVVRDFTGMEPEAIQAVLAQMPGRVCGRVDRSAVAPSPVLNAMALVRLPAERLRIFVLAFVMVFGLEVWGISSAEAQTVQPAVDLLQKQENLEAAVQSSADEIRIRGKVMDVYTREPVQYAHVMILEDGQLLKGTLTDEDGRFELMIEKETLKGDTFDLHLSYLGKTRKDKGLRKDLREFIYLIDASQMMEGLAINSGDWIPDDPYLMGDIISLGLSTDVRGYYSNNKALFRPLDEWLMMNFSEIHHSGRW
jgi:hypothetical protein